MYQTIYGPIHIGLLMVDIMRNTVFEAIVRFIYVKNKWHGINICDLAPNNIIIIAMDATSCIRPYESRKW